LRRNPIRVAEFFLGLDFGTAGARVCVLDEDENQLHASRKAYADPASPAHWRKALIELIAELPDEIRAGLSAIAIDGTSGTLLVTDADFTPVGPALLYNDGRASEEVAAISNPQFGPCSGLAKRLWLARHYADATYCFHQVDWLAAQLTGIGGVTDYHNALKSGYDVEDLSWPAWVSALPGGGWQQKVLTPGDVIGPLSAGVAARFKLNPGCVVRAGTTDSIAAFIASGASQPSEAVTSLGTTLVLKLLSEKRVEDPASGVYSHRFGKLWLVGGASNTGGGVLKQLFSDEELATLSAQINPELTSGLDYYPLPKTGERFPINDPALLPRITPRPENNVAFLHGLLEGMARIEAMGYDKLQTLGTTPLERVITSGGGAQNKAWRHMREKVLDVPVVVAKQTEAAYGAALLARSGSRLLP
jgi:D-ribulokinase